MTDSGKKTKTKGDARTFPDGRKVPSGFPDRPVEDRNPALLGLTDAETFAFGVIAGRQDRGVTTTNSDLVEAWNGKSRSYVFKVLKRLCAKGVVESYNRNFYRLKTEATKGK